MIELYKLSPRQLEIFTAIYYAWRFEGLNLSVTDLAQRCNTRRPTAQDYVQRLRKKGFLSENPTGERKITIPSAIRNYLEEKKDELPRLLSPHHKPRRMPNLQNGSKPDLPARPTTEPNAV